MQAECSLPHVAKGTIHPEVTYLSDLHPLTRLSAVFNPPFSVKMNPVQLILGSKNSSLYNIIISRLLRQGHHQGLLRYLSLEGHKDKHS